MTKLTLVAGTISANSSASTLVRMSSFTSELEAAIGAMKSLNRIATVIMKIVIDSTLPQLYSDNEAMIIFVK